MNTALTVTIIVVAIILFLILLAAARDANDRRGKSRRSDSRGGGFGFKDLGFHRGDSDCSSPGDKPHPPRDVCCDSDERFTATVSWKASASANVDHYIVYIKHLKHCDEQSGHGSHESSEHGGGFRAQGGRHGSSSSSSSSHGHGCRCMICVESSSSSSSSESCDRCECGPHDYDRIVKVAACDDRVVIRDIKQKAICVTVSAVSRCGRESGTANCCTTCIDCRCRIYPCIVENDCRGLTLKWDRVDCADCIKIYYDGELKFELPGDAQGVKDLPPVENCHEHVTVTTENKCGESKHYKISKICPCKGDCGDCQKCKKKPKKRKCYKCKKDKDSCGCGSPRRNNHSDSSHSNSSHSHH